nr:hypothetical protein Iba_scaffold17533CG0100 [Ipomoea batatas]
MLDENRQAVAESGGEAGGEAGGVVGLSQVDAKPAEDRQRNALNLQKGHFLSQTHPKSGLKNRVLERVFLEENPIFQPSLRLEFQAIGAPYPLHSPHCVRMIRNPSPPLHRRPIRQHVVLHAKLGVELDRREKPHALKHRRLQVIQLPHFLTARQISVFSDHPIRLGENSLRRFRISLVRDAPHESRQKIFVVFIFDAGSYSFSLPMFRNRLIFHTTGDALMALSADSFDAE